MNPHYPAVARRAAHRCEYCRAIFNFPFEVEHILPTSQQGADDDNNWALACRACNLRKAAHVSAPDDQTGRTIQLFHPRHDQWAEHFEFDLESGSILGKTPIDVAARLQTCPTRWHVWK